MLIQLELESIIDEASLFASCLQLVTDEAEIKIRINHAPRLSMQKLNVKVLHATHHTVPLVVSGSSSSSESSLELSRVIILRFLPPSDVHTASMGSNGAAATAELPTVPDEDAKDVVDDTSLATPGRSPAPAADTSERHEASVPLVHSASFLVKPSMLASATLLPGDASYAALPPFAGLAHASNPLLERKRSDRGHRPAVSRVWGEALQCSDATERKRIAKSF